jgi:hypothetical protein
MKKPVELMTVEPDSEVSERLYEWLKILRQLEVDLAVGANIEEWYKP